ncbi:uncharacterized protein LOC105383545 isoform X4 [Plutella xylostella]|nr:uncharacterized protein LOC105383545 isoform X4 [Plutella xylostella]
MYNKDSGDVETERTMGGKETETVRGVSSAAVMHAWGLILLSLVACVGASEFPERECCDPVYPPNTATTPAAPVTHPVSTKVVGPGLIAGPGIKGTMAILNCLLARQLCFEDASCAAILEIIPRVCGSELGKPHLACSTVTVTKCQAALRTLQAFPFFKPTCLCREPNVDPECNSFRDFLFDHPCVFVMKKEKDPYPVETLPTCTYALSVCHNEKACSVLFERFKNACKAREGECRMEDREACREAWAGLRLSPLFGCICPNTHMKKRCDRIFAVVNHNPCVVKLMSDGRIAIRNSTGASWIGGMSITQDGNLIAPDKIVSHVHRYSSPHYNPHGHHYHRWSHEPGGSADPLYATKTVYGAGYIDDNQRIGKENGKSGDDKVALQSTCHVALDSCIKDSECVTSLTPVLQKCHATDCDREGCMTALRGFYRKPGVHWNTEIAFCLCKKTDNKEDSCMNAQERLHPSCAQRPAPGAPLPACHTLAHACREEPECRIRLENYEQWCAVDAVTQGCAGSPAACRAAVVAVLGTQLRAACACRGTDFAQLYDCLGWQRLLWLNPCVVESQSDYHVKTYGSILTTPAVDNGIRYITIAPPPAIFHRTTTHHHRHTTHGTAQVAIPEIEQLSPITTMSEQTVGPNEIAQISEPVETTIVTTVATTLLPTTTTTTTTTTQRPTTTTTTTQRPTTTLEPAKYCIVKKPESDDEAQYIKMGETRRLYRSAELAECTDLCVCEVSLQVSCKVACVPRAPCSSRLAHYSHAAPAYQAYRGRCYCYSGSFICMRPNPGEYKLPEGVYLLLGFSSVDEALLRPHTGLGAEDAVRLLQQYMYGLHDQGTNCTLTLYNMSNENVIISASVTPREQEALREAGEPLLDREKEECIDILKVVKSRINSQHEDISSHLLLSIFKIAEVDVVYPTPLSLAGNNAPSRNMILFIVSTNLLLNYKQIISFVVFLLLTLSSTIVNFITNLLNKNNSKLKNSNFTDVSLTTVPVFKESYFVNDDNMRGFITILKIYREFIEENYRFNVVDVVNYSETLHRALALDIESQHRHITNTIVGKEDLDVFNCKEIKHIIKAVSITIFDNFNELVADVFIPKYFSRDVYYEIGAIDSEMLSSVFCVNDASSSYGIIKSVSLGLTLAVV